MNRNPFIWTKIEDQLPPVEVPFLAYDKKKNKYYVCCYGETCYGKQFWIECTEEIITITHWMPITEATLELL